jgi:copper resistance protein C
MNGRYGISSHLRGKAFILLTLLSAFACAPDGLAHARMIRSIPQKNAELSGIPKQIELWFNELLDDGFNSVEVFTAAELTSEHHTNLASEKAVVDPKDRTHLTVKLGPLSPGEYVVQWRVLSRDGHTAPGRLTFSVTGTN